MTRPPNPPMDAPALDAALLREDVELFLPANASHALVVVKGEGAPVPLGRIPREQLHVLLDTRRVREGTPGRDGRRFSPSRRRTARARRNAGWLMREREAGGSERRRFTVSLAESPVGWLAARKDAEGRPLIADAELAAAERLRADFEAAQLGPSVTLDWRRMLTAGVEAGAGRSAQEAALTGGAEAARLRMHDALAALGPDLSDAALRVCCFLEGLEQVEASMSWAPRSGKVVLRIALRRLAAHYEDRSTRKHGEITMWRDTGS